LANKKTIWTLVAVAGGAFAFYVYKIYKSIDIKFTSFSISSLFSNPNINAEFTIQNNSNLSVNINSINGVIYYDGKFLANVSTSGVPIAVNQNSQTFVDFKIEPTQTSVVNFASEMIQGKSPVFNFVGSVNIWGVPFPINQTMTM
jgi:hypothetical protein